MRTRELCCYFRLCYVVMLCHVVVLCHVVMLCHVVVLCHVMSCCNLKSCCQNQRVLRVSPGTQNQLVLLVLQKKGNPRKPQNVGKYEFLPLRLKNQRGCFWSTLRAKTWHVAQLGHIKWDKVSFQAVFHLSVIVKHPNLRPTYFNHGT